MRNFTYHNPTQIVFGKGTIAKLAELVPQDATILLTYGGGSIKRNGVYDQVMAALGPRKVFTFGGIEPNPCYETLMQAVALARQENVDFLLAVGGGSVLDGTKFIAAALKYEGADPWEILSRRAPVHAAVPLASVLTLPATGSEMNSGAVISRAATREKFDFGSAHTYPVFSILDPETTISLPARQVGNGIVDAFVHVTEQYMTYDVNAPLQARQAEAVLLTLI
jgi:NADP-dependent alcohol dehydrogenase